MQVELRLISGRKGSSGAGSADPGMFEIDEGETVRGLMDLAGVDRGRTLVVLVNGRHAVPERRLESGDVIAVFPPVAGG